MNAMLKIGALLLIVAAGCLTGLGQEKARALTLEDAVGLALKRNFEVIIAEEQLNELKGKIKEVRSGAFPQVSLQGYG
jgi:outer membrane protein TolC